jgi:hypothetical protein
MPFQAHLRPLSGSNRCRGVEVHRHHPVFGALTDITLHEMALETFFPADNFTRTALQKLV